MKYFRIKKHLNSKEQTSNGSGDVSRHDWYESSTQQSGSGVGEFLGEEEGDNCGEGTEERCEEDTHVPDVDCDVDQVKRLVYECSRHHQSWICTFF